MQLWAVLEPLLPKRVNTHRFGGGRPRVPDRRCADAIFYVLRRLQLREPAIKGLVYDLHV